MQRNPIHSQRIILYCKSVPAQSQKMTHNVTKLPQVKDNKSHVKHFCVKCVKYASPFFWHMVCQIRLKWSQQRIIVKHILHHMCQMWLCAGARFTVHKLNRFFHCSPEPWSCDYIRKCADQTPVCVREPQLLDSCFCLIQPYSGSIYRNEHSAYAALIIYCIDCQNIIVLKR
jgi:hypothetical protein